MFRMPDLLEIEMKSKQEQFLQEAREHNLVQLLTVTMRLGKSGSPKQPKVVPLFISPVGGTTSQV